MIFRLATVPLVFAAFAASSLQAQKDGEKAPVREFNAYSAAEPGAQVIDAEGLTLGDFQRYILLESLVAAGVNYSSATHERRSKAVALALQVDPAHPTAVAANSLMSEGRSRNFIDGYRVSSEIAEVLWDAVRLLKQGSEADQQLARYVMDIIWMCGSKDSEILSAIKTNREDGGPEWDTLFPPPPPPVQEVERNMLEEAVFTATETEASTLILVKVGDVYKAKPWPISVKAIREEPFRRRSWMTFKLGHGNVYVGSAGAWRGIEKLIPARGGEEWRTGYNITISSSFDAARGDRQSASVAAALALDSLLDGATYDPKFAVSGMILPDGAITKVGGIAPKLEGAAVAQLTHIALPKANEQDYLDYLADHGIAPFVKVQVFAVEHLDEVKALALAEDKRDFLVNESLKVFQETIDVISSSGGARALAAPGVQQRLRKVLELNANHVSARMLLLSGSGRGPKTRSLLTSYLPIKALANAIYRIESDNLSEGDAKKIDAIILDKNRYHPKAQPCIEGLMLVKDAQRLRRQTTAKRDAWIKPLENAQSAFTLAINKLKDDPEVRAEIDREASEPLLPDGTER